MKVTKAMIGGAEHWAIDHGNYVYFQRTHAAKATDNPMDSTELMICDMAEALASRPEETFREALCEILREHANDNHRPKAFYIAAKAIDERQPQ